ncbi:hypothetical protein HanIR_Chr17g0869901 [Helianthus annuus]|nr:hypothetical protein HanIR_Chr17g0869901 [Helianthus annuus]
MEPCRRTEQTDKNLQNRRLHTGRAQPTRPRAEPPAGNHPVQVTGHGPCSANTPPCPGFCFNSIIFVTGTSPRGRARSTRGRVQSASNTNLCF